MDIVYTLPSPQPPASEFIFEMLVNQLMCRCPIFEMIFSF
jgi:hypothetical protein